MYKNQSNLNNLMPKKHLFKSKLTKIIENSDDDNKSSVNNLNMSMIQSDDKDILQRYDKNNNLSMLRKSHSVDQID